MVGRRALGILGALGWAACGAGSGSPDGGGAEATACTPGVVACDADHEASIVCSPQGDILDREVCAVGCDDASGRCLDLLPSNGLAAALDLLATRPGVRAVTLGESQHTQYIDTDTGAVNTGVPVDIPSVEVGGVRVFLFDQLWIRGGRIRVWGSRPAAFVAAGDITIESQGNDPDVAVLDVGGHAAEPGPGTRGNCVGGASEGSEGGGGGGSTETGGAGGTGRDGSPGAPGGVASPHADAQPLVGGCAGGGNNNTAGARGGGGGGAIQIVSRTEIRIARAVIDASGGGGYPGPSGPGGSQPGVGGGGGGTILLEAPVIRLEGGAVLSTKGGGGSSVHLPGFGAGLDGGSSATPAGCLPSSCGTGCGRGGTGAQPAEAGAAGTATTCAYGGGGGGAVGQVRLNTRTGAAPTGDYTIRSRVSTGAVATRPRQ